MNLSVVLAAGNTSLLLIGVGIVVVLVLLGAFSWGSRRTADKTDPVAPEENRTEQGSGGSQRGDTWQTIDDDPDQGNPHRDRDH